MEDGNPVIPGLSLAGEPEQSVTPNENAQEPGATLQTPAEPVGATGDVDWEARFKGLQTTLNRKDQEMKELQQRLTQMDQRVFEVGTMHLPPAQRQAELQRYQFEQYQTQLQARERDLEAYSRAAVISALSRETGADPSVLAQFDSPEEMQLYATSVQQQQRQAQAQASLQQRQASGVDRFEPSGASVSPPAPVARTLEEAARNFAEAAKRRGFS